MWRLEHFSGDTYVLTNTGRAIAFDVNVDLGELTTTGAEELGADEMPPEGWLRFSAMRLAFDDTVTITWADHPDGEPHMWSRPLPSRPARDRPPRSGTVW